MKVCILFSGRGSNVKAILDKAGKYTEVVCAMTDNPLAPGIQVPFNSGIPTVVLPSIQCFPNCDRWERHLMDRIEDFDGQLIVLAGFMRVLHNDFCREWRGRCINIHPSCLPKFPGLNTHQRVLESGDLTSGCSVHFVTSTVDGGPIIAQQIVPVEPNDCVDSLADRVLVQEHLLYPEVVNALCEKRIRYIFGNKMILWKDKPLDKPLSLSDLIQS